MQWTAHGRPGLRRNQAGGRRGRGCIYACAERGGRAPSKMRTLLISLEMENSSTHAMRAAEARDTVCGARLEGSTRPDRPLNSESDMDAVVEQRVRWWSPSMGCNYGTHQVDSPPP